MQSNDLARAKEYFEQALKSDPENSLGVVYEREGKKAEAESMYRRVLNLEPPAGKSGEPPRDDSMREMARESLNNLKAGDKRAH